MRFNVGFFDSSEKHRRLFTYMYIYTVYWATKRSFSFCKFPLDSMTFFKFARSRRIIFLDNFGYFQIPDSTVGCEAIRWNGFAAEKVLTREGQVLILFNENFSWSDASDVLFSCSHSMR